ncbi:MAG: hypothetical protein ACXVCY_07515 [Pseudobdellovibrionaceae bacterium]
MPSHFKTLILLIFGWPTAWCSCAIAENAWPSEIKKTVEDWKTVTSISFDYSGREVSGTVVKRWEVRIVKGVPTLSEVLPLTTQKLLKDPSDPKKGVSITWTYEKIPLSSSISIQPFLRGRTPDDPFTYNLVQLDKSKIILSFTNSKNVLILVPSTPLIEANPYLVGKRNLPGLSKTPDNGRGIGNASIKTLFGISIADFPGPQFYLNHSVKYGARSIVVSPEFPDSYIEDLHAVIEEWNNLFGNNYYSFLKKSKIDPTECLTQNLLCIQWTGGERFNWTDYSGTTEVAADPGTGQVLGGIIYLHNNADPKNVRQGSTEELAEMGNPDDLLAVIRSYLNYTKYSTIWRENSHGLVKYLLLHEMGHYFGWDHNFGGSQNSSVMSPGDTVMGYPPFLLVDRFDRLGKLDKDQFTAVYIKKSQKLANPFCGDLDIVPKANNNKWNKTKPECYMFMVGNTTDWLISQSQIYGIWATTYMWGVYKALTPTKIELGSYLAGIGFIAKSSSSPANRKKANDYLCSEQSHDSTISTFLLTNLDLVLHCK